MARKVWRLTDLPAIFSKGDFYSGGVRCLLPELKYSTNGVRRSGIQLDLELASTFPLLRTPPERFCSSSYKHATPNGVKPVTLFFTTSVAGGSPDFRFLISDCQLALWPAPIENRQLTIGNPENHPLPRGGTDLMGPRHVSR